MCRALRSATYCVPGRSDTGGTSHLTSTSPTTPRHRGASGPAARCTAPTPSSARLGSAQGSARHAARLGQTGAARCQSRAADCPVQSRGAERRALRSLVVLSRDDDESSSGSGSRRPCFGVYSSPTTVLSWTVSGPPSRSPDSLPSSRLSLPYTPLPPHRKQAGKRAAPCGNIPSPLAARPEKRAPGHCGI